MKFRIERDSIGEKQVPAGVLYGIHTVRAMENFPHAGKNTSESLIKAIIDIKRTSAIVNKTEGFMEPAKADAIVLSCDELLDKYPAEQFHFFLKVLFPSITLPPPLQMNQNDQGHIPQYNNLL